MDRINTRQLQALLVLNLFGMAAIYLPGIAVEAAERDGWVGVGLASVFAVLGCYLICSLAVIFRGMSFHDIACLLLSRPLGKLVCIILALRAIAALGLELRIFGEVIRSELLPFTPFWIVGSVMILLGGLAAFLGYGTRARIAEILVFVAFAPFLLNIGLAAFSVDFSNLTPVLESHPQDILAGVFESGFAFFPIVNLLAAVPFVVNFDNKARRRTVWAVVFAGALLTATTVLVLARLKASGAAAQNWPLLEMFFTVELPGAFMERQNALVISFWILTVFIGAGAGLFLGAHLFKEALSKGRRNFYLIFVMPAVLVLSLLPENASRAVELARMLYRITGPGLMLILPFVMLLLARLRRRLPR